MHMKKKIVLFLILFLFGITGVKAADVASVNGENCTSIANAIKKVTSSEKTTITLLMDRNENITIPEGKNIVLDLNGYTLGNNGASSTVITNNGTLEITNGTVTSTASSGMINNNSTGKLTIKDGSYIATGSRQVVYNKGGTATLGGTAIFESETPERATVHNLDNGKLYIEGGTIIANNSYAVYNDKGTLNIGVKNEVYNQSSPVIQGKTYGVIANNKINVYDGIIKGVTSPLGTANSNNAPTTNIDTGETKIEDIEELSEKVIAAEVISGDTYNTLTYNLDNSKIVKVTFNPAGGDVSPTSKKIYKGDAIGSLPEPIKQDHTFDGWYTDPDNGTKITENTKPSSDTTYYAHWTYVDPNKVAYVDGIGYTSLQVALALGGNIKLMSDVVVTSNLEMHKEAILDLNGHTIIMKNSKLYIEEKVTIDDKSSSGNGKITSNANFTVIVGEDGISTNAHLIHKGGIIEGTGVNGAIYNYETTEIDGGTVQANNSGNGVRYTVYNRKNLLMKDGTIYSANGRAVQVYENANFIMDGGLIKADSEGEQVVNLYGNCSATINGGRIEGLKSQTAGIAAFANTNLEINGGTIIGSDMAVTGNGNENSGNVTITVNGGDLIATTGVGMYLPQRNSITTINGGNISGPTGIEIRASKLVINDGNITGTSETYSNTTNPNGTTSLGAAVAVAQHNTKLPIEVIINGGNLKALVPIVESNPQGNSPEDISKVSIIINKGNFESTGDKVIDAENPEIIIQQVSGGTYTYDPINYVADGYGVATLQDGRFEVTKIHNIVIDSDSADNVSVDKSKYPYKTVVKLKVKEKDGYNAVIKVIDENGKEIEVNDNKFTMPDSDVTVSIKYTKKLIPINPKTGDSIIVYMFILLLSVIDLGLYKVYKKGEKDV